jgi:hypothetical protein
MVKATKAFVCSMFLTMSISFPVPKGFISSVAMLRCDQGILVNVLIAVDL